MTSIAGVYYRFERSQKVMALIKLANVAFTMAWGFAVTYVFVRALPLPEFQAFLLLVAFGNFTVSAEFGVTSIIYSRLRRYWLASAGAGDDDDFRMEEIGFLFAFLIGLVTVAGIVLGGLMMVGFVRTGMPLLFFLYFVSACLNAVLLLVKRALAAIDHNLFWEGMDLVRRVLTLLLLLAVLVGFDVTLSVAGQLLLAVAATLVGSVRLHQRLRMRGHHWLSLRSGGRHVRARYLGDIGSTVSLTLSEMTAYNAPYFTIALATHDARPMLLFDFTFKMARALSLVVRATVEAALPRLTAAYYERRGPEFRRSLWMALATAATGALGAGIALAIVGRWLVRELFHGELPIGMTELLLIGLLMLVLSVTCVSVYLQGALGRFSMVLKQSVPFLAGSLLSVPVAMLLSPVLGIAFPLMFLIAYAAVFAGTALLHAFSLAGLMRGVSAAP